MKHKPKFKMSTEDLLQFNDDCIEAALECPQVRLDDVEVFEDRDTLRRRVSAKKVVKWWKDVPVLWDSGYYKCLTDEALDVFAEYKLYKAKKRLWKRSKE